MPVPRTQPNRHNSFTIFSDFGPLSLGRDAAYHPLVKRRHDHPAIDRQSLPAAGWRRRGSNGLTVQTGVERVSSPFVAAPAGAEPSAAPTSALTYPTPMAQPAAYAGAAGAFAGDGAPPPFAAVDVAEPDTFATQTETAVDDASADSLEFIHQVDLDTIESIEPAGRLTEAPVIDAGDRDAQLALLRERLAFYEAFDSLIQDNVARSAELFRSLFEERERAKAEAANQRAELEANVVLQAERTLAGERERYHLTLLSLMDDASAAQRQIDGLIQRLAHAIGDVAGNGPTQSAGVIQRFSA
jgi:hypothetical protein